ncbi:MAG TPA: MerR family transcriptional regulator [Rhodoblastus sp.]|nr:MerR family transcriptional regulator [Rhodoblastus sp.]
MNIGELAKRSGLTASTIRFYERSGLLATVERRPNGYRTYPPEAVLALDLIATAQRAGFSLDEIRSLLPSDLQSWEHGALIAALRRKVSDIEALQARLARSKADLVALIGEIEAKPDDVDCAENARRVLTRILDKKVEKPALAPGEVRRLGKVGRRRTAG